jgi:CBS domain-containing protein
MICPACNYSNIEGADECEVCDQSLTDLESSTSPNGPTDHVSQSPISRVPRPPTIMVLPTTPIREVVDRLAAGNVGCVLVVGPDGVLAGVLSERDLLMKAANSYEDAADRPAAEFMTPNPSTLPPDATVAWALNRMNVGGFRHIPIVEDGRPVSVVSVRDLLGFLAESYASQPT